MTKINVVYSDKAVSNIVVRTGHAALTNTVNDPRREDAVNARE